MNLVSHFKNIFSIAAAYLLVSTGMYAQTTKQIETFHLKDVTLLASPFKHAQQLNKQYLLALDADRLLAPFVREAGLAPKAKSYTNWENTGLDGHIGGHYLSALSLMYASTADTQIKERLDYMLHEMKRIQDTNGNGYIGGVPDSKTMWSQIAQGNIKASGFALNGKWVPLYNIHKTYAGLRDAYLYADSELAKTMLLELTDWMIDLTQNLSDEQMQDMLRSEYGGLNETFADVAAISGDEKYIQLAKRFSHLVILNPLLEGEDKLTGMHANTQIPKVLGYKRIADISGDNNWANAAQFFWETVVEHRSVCIGGNSANEHFHPSHNFERMIKSTEGPETCNTYNMLRLTKMLYQTSLNEKYIDYYERGLYNHILSSQHPETGGLVYFTQMRPGHYRVYSQPETSMWCCVGSGIENHSKYGEMIYAHTENELYVNLFIPSTLQWKEKEVKVIQQNNFPNEAKTELTIEPQKNTDFTLKLRYPSWVEKGALKISINGKPLAVSQNPASYVSINRKWKKGDKVTMEMPMRITTEQLPDNSNYFSFRYGPIVLAAKTGTEDLKGLFADDSRGGHIAHGKQLSLNEMPIIVSEVNELTNQLKPVANKPLTFSLTNLFPQKYEGGLELIPFYTLHDARYIIYWAQATTQSVKEIQTKIEQEEKEREALNNRTIDRLTCGEQQPESDHFIQFDDSWTGSVDGISWRECKGYFSYQLKNENKDAKQLYVAYFDKDHHRNLRITINDIEVFNQNMKGDKGDDLQTMYINIPQSEKGKQRLIIKFTPTKQGDMTNKITEVRLLNQ
ncbi:glycoside hydrolase family 127 protein [Bacteroides propionicifaciens]|uniref:glycoside hydrolase family 127 protein n=1 Tax=Bacteroides propionicifaciens TaxID=392838 RepID=UPI00039D5901|nr:glycoside hydrolase family 127 protein [Bacteroides propionicifaciens]